MQPIPWDILKYQRVKSSIVTFFPRDVVAVVASRNSHLCPCVTLRVLRTLILPAGTIIYIRKLLFFPKRHLFT
jgi:hypothetical protein